VRIGVARLHRTLLGVEIRAALQAIVFVARSLRKQRAEGVDVGRNVPGAEPGGEAAIEKASGRVERPVKTAGIRLEGLVFGREARPEVNDVKTGSGCYLECDVERFGKLHQGVMARTGGDHRSV
jgi:hypothetical protein